MTQVGTTLPLVEQFQYGLDAPICLTWELTYACNLACVHCLSSSGRRDPRELTTAQCRAVIDELERMQVFYVNIGGGGSPVVSVVELAFDIAPPLAAKPESQSKDRGYHRASEPITWRCHSVASRRSISSASWTRSGRRSPRTRPCGGGDR